MNQYSSKTKRVSKIFFLVLLIILGIGIFCWTVYKWIERPKYIILQIPSPISYLPRGNWLFTQFTVNTFTDDQSRYFLVRMETTAYGKGYDQQHGFDSWKSVADYFDEYLSKKNWRLYSSEAFDPCAALLPESKFLDRGEGGYVIYRRPNTKDYIAEPTVCLAIWPSDYVGFIVRRFEIVLVTINPSTFTQ